LAHDVFISCTIADKVVAEAVRHRLEEAGIRCWIAPRDVGFGDWGAAIVDAISEARPAASNPSLSRRTGGRSPRAASTTPSCFGTSRM
jgi:hypothetical protein